MGRCDGLPAGLAGTASFASTATRGLLPADSDRRAKLHQRRLCRRPSRCLTPEVPRDGGGLSWRRL
eukprot:10921313-Heterocapsa_arctica.AAC.1